MSTKEIRKGYDQRDIDRRTCQSCGMLLDREGEFHPHSFCIWKKAGHDPWEMLARTVDMLGVDVTHWPKRPPLVRDL